MHRFLHAFSHIWTDMAPWLLLGFFFAFLCSYFLNESLMRRHLGGKGWLPILKASVIGLPLPICSCGVLLVGLALRKNGARKAPVCAFLASTPQSGTDSLLVSWPLLGPVLTLLRFLGAVSAGLLSGILMRRFGKHQPHPQETTSLDTACAGICACHHHDAHHPHREGEAHHHEHASRLTRLKEAARYAFIHLPGEIAILLTVGIALSAAISALLPPDLFQDLPLAAGYCVAFLIGLPLYACSLAIVPVAASLIAMGLTPGTAFIFMCCASTTHLGALFVLGKELGVRTALLFTAGVLLAALAMALLIDFPLNPILRIPPMTHHHHGHAHFGALPSLWIVGFLLANGVVFSLRARLKGKQ